MLADDQIDRYSRQILLREIGARGQEQLIGSSVAIAGCRSVAHLCALYITGAGAGHIRILHSDRDPAGAAEALADDLSRLNPEVRVELGSTGALLAPNTPHLEPAPTVLIDTTADVATLTAATAMAAKRCTVLAAGIRSSNGWLARHGSGTCIVCVALHEGTSTAGVASGEPAAVGIVASLLAFDALAALLGWQDEERNGWRRYDGTNMSLGNARFTPHPDCTLCGATS
jgi:hypothetical protein